MGGWTSRPGLAVIVVVCVAFGSLGLVAAHASPLGVASHATHSIAAVGSTPSTAAGAAGSAKANGLAKALSIENGLRAKGISPTHVHLPNFPGAVADPAQPVTPSYVQAPAPMGVADIGLMNQSGVLVPYELNTTSVAGTVNITNLEALYVDGDGPDTYGIQLNSVAAGVTIFGNSSFEFWSQNYVDYTPSTQQLVFGDEVWNFSSPSGLFPTNSVYGFSPNGTWGAFPYLYQGFGPAITIGYPFTLTLYLNTSTIADRPVFYFNYTLSNDTFRQSSSFDYLIFNSSVGTPTQAAPTPYYQADGYNYDPIGLINDMEIDLLGNDDGDTTAFLAANATVSLQFWNATAEEMQEVPSAYNAGQETGETSVGLSVSSSGGASPVGIVREGPGFLGGLWNYSAGVPAVPFTLTLHPANAFLFVNVGNTENDSAAQWVPTLTAGTTTFYVPAGGTYYLNFLMSDHTPTSLVKTATGPMTLPTVTLVRNTAEGVYTPLFALSNAELPGIAASGTGTAADPYILFNNQRGSLDPQFAQWDDYLFPVFPGVLLADTSAVVEVAPPSFDIDIPSWQLSSPYIAALGLPLSNDLQIQFYDASNISLVQGSGISGWLSAFLYEYPESSVMIWDCANVLVASNTFEDQGNALLLYGGANNTVWGNTFLTALVFGTNPGSLDDAGAWVTGVNETESNDTIYNNLFEVPVPAITPTVDPFPCDQYGYCYSVNYTDTWNVSEQPATNYTLVNGWNLTGSIIGTSYQGGSYWSNYGTTLNPYGVIPLTIPYNDSGWITAGGDYVPLVPFALYPVTFEETGLSPGSHWNVTENGVVVGSKTSSIEVWSPNGTFPLSAAGPARYVVTSAPPQFAVAGVAVTVQISFARHFAVEVQAQGLAISTEWSASINGTWTENNTVWKGSDQTTIVFAVPPGAYNVTAKANGYNVTPTVVSLTVDASEVVVPFTFSLLPGTLVLDATPAGASVWVDGQPVALSEGSASLTVPAGPVAIEATYPGYYPYINNVTVTSNTTTTVPIVLNPVTPPIGADGTLSVTVTPATATVWVDGVQVALTSGAYSATAAPGLHSVEATLAGYYAYFNNVTVSSETTTDLAIALNPVTPPVGADGTLSLTVTPATATVWVDGAQVVLTSGAYSTSETPGLHSVEATLAGYYAYFNNVTVSSGTTTDRAIALNPVAPPVGADGTLSLTVAPATATVWVDGAQAVLTSGAYSASETPGVHSIEVTATDYYPYFNNVTVKSSTTTTVPIVLNPVTPPIGADGTLSLTVTPATATVWVDGAQVALTSGAYSASEAPGVHSVEVTATGYYTYFNNVTVSSSTTSTVPVSLNTVSSSSSGGSGISNLGWIIIAVLVALALIFLVAMVYFARRPRQGTGGAETSSAREWQEAPPEAPPPSE